MPEKAVHVRQIGSRQQCTIARPTEVHGPGLVTGIKVSVKIFPAPANTGVVFVRTDVAGEPVVPARVDVVTGTNRRTTLGGGPEAITLVEHLLATLAGMQIDNCIIELDGPEPPGLDGSATGFVNAIAEAGVVKLQAKRAIWAAIEPVTVQQGGATVTIEPPARHEENLLKSTYILDYGQDSPIPKQTHTMFVSPETFEKEVSNCRTFVLEREALMLLNKGVGKHLTARDLLVFGPDGLMDNELRFSNEPARHKVLDLIGDLSLCGVDLVGHVIAYRSGHSLNVNLARTLAIKARAAGAELPPLRDWPMEQRRAFYPGRKRHIM